MAGDSSSIAADKLDAALLDALERTIPRYIQTIRAVLDRVGGEVALTLPQYGCLKLFGERAVTLTTYLARRMQVTVPTMTSRLDGLVERVGMKPFSITTRSCFIVGSALCGLAWNPPSLVAFRHLQGRGGGILQPLGMAIVFTMITPLELGQCMDLLGLPMLLALITWG